MIYDQLFLSSWARITHFECVYWMENQHTQKIRAREGKIL